MYLEHFGLDELPFGITPDTGFTFASATHHEALATLLHALEGGEGFVKVTGEVGTGKTLLARTLLHSLAGRAVVTAYIPNPHLTPRELLAALADELALTPGRRPGQRTSQRELHDLVQGALLAHAEAGRRVVLIIDEAQALPPPTLEGLRLLSNLETGKRKLLQVALFGQPELDSVISDPACRSLASRIAFAAWLAPLPRRDLASYVQHRLRVAGWRGPPLFTPAALWLLHRASGGVPRRANILAHKSLMLAYGQGLYRVGLAQAWPAVRDHRRTWRRHGGAVAGAGAL
ncbi:MAG: AAA family ATPase [Rubrivivax sp.]|nr:AAA family ATPase [Rubrivivax sp.]